MRSPRHATSRTAALVVTTTSAFLVPYMFSAINVALPQLGQEFNMDAVLLGWVGTAYLLTTTVFLLPFGRLADIHGRKRAFITGVSLLSLSSLLSVLASSQIVFIGLRLLQGMAGAMMSGTTVAILTSVFPASERGKVLGINTASVYVGLTVGPFAGGLQTQYLGWRTIFITTAILGLVIVLLALGKLRGEWAEARGEGFDVPGSVIYGLALMSVIYGFSALPGAPAIAVTAIGIAGLLAFIRWELRARTPMLDLRLFKGNPVFTFSNLAALINYCSTFGIFFFLSLYLQYIRGMDPRSAGLVLVVQPAMMAIVSPFAGRLSDRVEPRIVASSGMALTTLGLALLASLGPETPIGFLVGVLVMQGLGFGLFSSPNTNAVMSGVDRSRYGVAAAILGTMRHTGQVFSLAIAMLIVALFIGPVPITPQNHGALMTSARTGFGLFALLSMMGVLASLKRGKVRVSSQ